MERTIRTTGLTPNEPWDAGAVMNVLPKLFVACPDLDWSKPLREWTREEMTEFLLAALKLMRRAMVARDFSERQLTGGDRADVIARQANCGAGGPRMTPDELELGHSFLSGAMSAHDYSDADDYVKLLNEPVNVELNALSERVALATPRLTRAYLGASSAGDECLRKIQFEWVCSSFEGARQRLRFDRGHAAEATMRAQLSACGLAFAPPEALEFQALEYLKGHADGIIIGAPHLPGVHLMLPAIWECKMIYAKGWRALAKDGLAKTYPKYATQVALYQHYLDKLNPALLTAINADSCEVLHLLVPYDRARAEQAIARIVEVIEATKAQRLLARAYSDPSDFRCLSQYGHRDRCWKLP